MNLKSRYKNSALGFLWSLLNPLLMMVVLTVVFSSLFKFEVEKYPAFLLIGLVSWRFFTGTATVMNSVVSNAALVRKIYFPREILTLSSTISLFITTLIESFVLLIFLMFLGVGFSVLVLMFPFILVLQFIFVLGLSLFLSSLYVHFRDLTHIWEVLLQAMFYLTPILYPVTYVQSFIHGPFLVIYLLNPMARFVIIYKDILYYKISPSPESLVAIILYSLLSLSFGHYMFKKMEPKFAEVV